ncbi:MAG: methyltransferase [Rhodospirillales bacterium 69-11]|jgi:SAM-dependent methyltransferase|nr:MAG: methyltransferase [Rhodospirillales bacterium 69-11]
MAGKDPDAVRANAWLEVSDLVDLQLSPLGLRAMDALAPKPSEVIVDVGCGTGQTVLQLAEQVGPEGQVIGVDIVPSLLERARLRGEGLRQARFIACDAAQLRLPEKSVDCVFSRFGVMAFADPVAAFANFHRTMKRSGRLAFVCWRALEENELDIMPLRAAGLETRVDRTPFRFEKPEFIRTVLSDAGFGQIVIEPYDRAVSSGGLEAMLTVLLKVGAVGKIVRENPEMYAAAERRLRTALATRVVDGRVALNAGVWLVTAAA